MRINGPGPLSPSEIQRRESRKRDGEARFSVAAEDETASARSLAPAVPLAPVDALLTLQEVDPDEARARPLVRRGHELLDRLDEIRHGLLTGAIPRSRLKALAQRLEEARPHVDDQKLLLIINEIELRVAVELAKYSVSK